MLRVAVLVVLATDVNCLPAAVHNFKDQLSSRNTEITEVGNELSTAESIIELEELTMEPDEKLEDDSSDLTTREPDGIYDLSLEDNSSELTTGEPDGIYDLIY